MGAMSTGAVVRGGESGTPMRATCQDVLDAPANRVAEIVDVDGVLYTQPRPAMPHAATSASGAAKKVRRSPVAPSAIRMAISPRLWATV